MSRARQRYVLRLLLNAIRNIERKFVEIVPSKPLYHVSIPNKVLGPKLLGRKGCEECIAEHRFRIRSSIREALHVGLQVAFGEHIGEACSLRNSNVVPTNFTAGQVSSICA